MATLNLLRKSTTSVPAMQGYRMTLEITSSDDITKNVFVNQRIRDNTKQTFEDVFVAIATPAQLEDFAEDAPNNGTSYFRTSKVDILSRNLDYLESVFHDIVNQLQKLVGDVDSLSVLSDETTYQITADQIS
jgi:hypothetical protein